MNENDEHDKTAAPDPEALAEESASEEPTAAGAAAQQEPAPIALYVRRGRTPTLGFWLVVIAAASAVIGIVVALLHGVGDASVMLNLALLSLVAIGMPLAGIAVLIDAVRNRRRTRAPRGSARGAVADHTDEQS